MYSEKILCLVLFLFPVLGNDFNLPSPAEVSFLALDNPVSGATECINVIIDDDDNYEGEHMFMVAFGSLSVSSTLATTTGPNAAVTIQDNGINLCIIISR